MIKRALTGDDLKCLNHWTEKTPGYINEQQIIVAILKICNVHGFWKVKQLINAMNEIWHDRDKITVYQNARQAILVENQSSSEYQNRG